MAELEKQNNNLKLINLKLETKIGNQDKERKLKFPVSKKQHNHQNAMHVAHKNIK